MALEEYEREILSCQKQKCESVFQRIADSYEDDLLEFNDFPEEYLSFLLRLLSEEQFFKKPGLWNFMIVIGTEYHKLSSIQYKKIADCILDNYIKYQDEDLNLAVCDFIARNYTHKKAKKLLLSLKIIEKGKVEKGFADDGLRILNNEIERSKLS